MGWYFEVVNIGGGVEDFRDCESEFGVVGGGSNGDCNSGGSGSGSDSGSWVCGVSV